MTYKIEAPSPYLLGVLIGCLLAGLAVYIPELIAIYMYGG